MNYLCSYWLNPDADPQRVAELKRYFDLQCYLKQQMGSKQFVMTNIDYSGALKFDLPKSFSPKYALFTRYFALAQLVRLGVSFPICVHDHDLFHAKPLEFDDKSILVSALIDGFFSDQLVVYPESAKAAIIALSDYLGELNFEAGLQSGYGTEIRHEGLYSTEQTFFDLKLRPFESLPMRQAFNVKDQVSFDIVSQHSLDSGSADSRPIPRGTHAVHGHLNKGLATDTLLNWLASEM